MASGALAQYLHKIFIYCEFDITAHRPGDSIGGKERKLKNQKSIRNRLMLHTFIP